MRLPIVIPSVIALLAFFASSAAPADPSIVADLDSNVTNGPDTTGVDKGDTVLVRLWITGADSLYAFGITFGDTSGTLEWISDTVTAIYLTPNGWTDTPVQVQANGTILLQGTDFGFATPLHTPTEIARLQFKAKRKGVCPAFIGDLALSGWMDTGLAEQSFAGFEGAKVCVSGQQVDGTGPEEGDGGSTTDGTPPARFPVKGITSYPPASADILEGMVIVQFRKGAFVPDAWNAPDGPISAVTIGSPTLMKAFQLAGVDQWRRLAWNPSASWSPANPAIPTSDGFSINYESRARTYVLRGSSTTTDILKRLEAASDTYVYAEPLIGWDSFGFPSVPDTTPGDSLYALDEQAWAQPIDTSGSPLRYGIDAPGAWRRTTGNPAIRLGIVDTGLRSFHPDFVTYPDSNLVYEFYDTCWPSDSLTPWASSGHGTSVIGIAAGLTHNRRSPADTLYIGTAGVAGGVDANSLTMVRTKMYYIVGTQPPECAAPIGMIAALDQAITDQIDVMNFSNGSGGLAYAEALARAYQAGISIVAAIGNLNQPNFRPLPAASQTNRTIAVSNGRITGERFFGTWNGSSYGRWNDVMAPGHDAMAPTWNAPWWAPFGGSSAASPMVAGTAALLASRLYDVHGDHSLHEELEALVIAGAVESKADTIPGHDKYYGHGFLNARNSIRFTDPDRFRRGRFTTSGLDGDSVALHETKNVILCTAGEYIPVVSPSGDTLVDGEYSNVQVYKATKTVNLHAQYLGDSVVVAGIGHGLPTQSFQSSGWTPGDSLQFSDSLGGTIEKAVLFRDRYCMASFLPTNEIRLTSYFWRFPLSPTDTVWAPFDPTDPQNPVQWAYAVFGLVDPTSVLTEDGQDSRDPLSAFEAVPNPFNPTVEIRFRLDDAGMADVTVFDIRGRRIRTLFHAMAQARLHTIVWNGRDDAGRRVASGTYFVSIQAADLRRTTKITLVRWIGRSWYETSYSHRACPGDPRSAAFGGHDWGTRPRRPARQRSGLHFGVGRRLGRRRCVDRQPGIRVSRELLVVLRYLHRRQWCAGLPRRRDPPSSSVAVLTRHRSGRHGLRLRL